MKVNDRVKNLSEFKEGKQSVMVTTDVGARGLDFEDLDFVIQYDFAKNAAALLHRFGRTGRLNRPGRVLSYWRDTEGDEKLLVEFEKVRKNGEEVTKLLSRMRDSSQK